MTEGQFDLNTPEGRLERGVYDQAVDPFIPEEVKARVAENSTEHELGDEPTIDPMDGKTLGELTSSIVRESIDLTLSQLGMSGLITVRTYAKVELEKQQRRER